MMTEEVISPNDSDGFLDENSSSAHHTSPSKVKKKMPGSAFSSLGLSAAVSSCAGKYLGFRVPTPIQRRTIPTILRGRDAVVVARTGSGKTAAFVLPLVDMLGDHSSVVGVRSLIVAPTRELIQQTASVVTKVIKNSSIKMSVLLGGVGYDRQFNSLSSNPDIILATPGRLLQFLNDSIIDLNNIKMIVLDEVDRMFELGWHDQIRLWNFMPTSRQAVLVSATLPSKVTEFSRFGLSDPLFVKIDNNCEINENVNLHFFYTPDEDKVCALIFLLKKFQMRKLQSLVFVSTRHQANYVEAFCGDVGIDAAVVYGAMEQDDRTRKITDFRKGRITSLIVTDVAARGLDIPSLPIVLNFDFPSSPKLFVHRVGRTARAGRSGDAISLVSPSDIPYAIDLMTFLGARIVPLKEWANNNTTTTNNNVSNNDDTNNIEDDKIYGTSSVITKTSVKSCYPLASVPDLYYYREYFNKKIKNNDELIKLRQSASSAQNLYFKTRPSASKMSCHRAKELIDKCGGSVILFNTLHPYFHNNNVGISLLSDSSSSLTPPLSNSGDVSLLESLKKFRPKAGERGSALKTDIVNGIRRKISGRNIIKNIMINQINNYSNDIYNNNNINDNLDNGTNDKDDGRKNVDENKKEIIDENSEKICTSTNILEDTQQLSSLSSSSLSLSSSSSSSSSLSTSSSSSPPSSSSPSPLSSLLSSSSPLIKPTKVRISKRRRNKAIKILGINPKSPISHLDVNNVVPIKNTNNNTDKDIYIDTSITAKTAAQNVALSLKAETLDLLGDEQDAMRRNKYTEKRKWDPSKRKYVVMKIDSTSGLAMKRRRVSAAKEEKTTSASRYREWCKSTKRRIQRIGETERSEASIQIKKISGKGKQSDDGEEGDGSPGFFAVTAKHAGLKEALRSGSSLTNKQARMVKKLMTKNSSTGKGEKVLSPEEIARKRVDSERRRIRADPRRRAEARRASKDKWMQKQQKKMARRGAPNRSFVIKKADGNRKGSKKNRR